MERARDSEGELFYYKVVLIGNGKVGKTSLRRDFMGESFRSDYMKTLMADFASHTLEMGDYTVNYSIWDLAGQPEMEEVRTKYYYGAFGAVLVFDITNRESFENLDNWIEQLQRSTMNDGTPVVIAANKMDLVPEQQEVEMEEVNEYVDDLRERYPYEVHLVETSAKTGKNVQKAFELLADSIQKWKNQDKEEKN